MFIPESHILLKDAIMGERNLMQPQPYFIKMPSGYYLFFKLEDKFYPVRNNDMFLMANNIQEIQKIYNNVAVMLSEEKRMRRIIQRKNWDLYINYKLLNKEIPNLP